MAISLSRQGEFEVLSALIREPITLRLFKNDIIPHRDNIFKDFKQVSGGGYKPQTLTTLNWKFKIIEDEYTTTYLELEFLFLTPLKDPIFGSYATKLVDGKQKVIWADRSSEAPLHIIIRGDRIVISPQLKIATCL